MLTVCLIGCVVSWYCLSDSDWVGAVRRTAVEVVGKLSMETQIRLLPMLFKRREEDTERYVRVAAQEVLQKLPADVLAEHLQQRQSNINEAISKKPEDGEEDLYGSCHMAAHALSDSEDDEEEELAVYNNFDHLLVTYRVAMKWLNGARAKERERNSALRGIFRRGLSQELFKIDLGDSDGHDSDAE